MRDDEVSDGISRSPLSSTDSNDPSSQSSTNIDNEQLSLAPLGGNEADIFSSTSSADTNLGDISLLPSGTNDLEQPLAFSNLNDGNSIFSADTSFGDSGQDIFAFGNTASLGDTQPNLHLSDDFGIGGVAKRARRKGRV